MTNSLFIVWTKYQSRAESLAIDFDEKLNGVEIVYRENPPANKIKKVFMYLKYFYLDFKQIKAGSYKSVFVQTPPSYALAAPLFVRRFFKKDLKVISDCHNALTREPWLSTMGNQKMLEKCDSILLHNEVVFEKVINEKTFPTVDQKRILILEDKTPFTFKIERKAEFLDVKKPYVFFPASFNHDEPILEVIKAAELLAEVHFVMTGNPKKLEKNFNIAESDIPSNMTLSGWLTIEEYKYILQEADVLIGLTLFDDIQMSVSNEGLGAEKAMVLSNKKALKNIYLDGAFYTENEAKDISKTITLALENKEVLEMKIKKVKEIKEKRYEKQLELVFKSIT
ncbi:hypothetical protein [Sporosarcina sp. E16_8]|uniref:hypothetical protein n=1 Tax=Sporosarcina sp. E16_8 TaxID=2789295 RepID=UPI001A925F9B|nr:hypothetical protein [Sporosarcina sp. E16_8]MBO0589175.1 hypothetical protein [Sporosarcina sp. E16_8]